MCSGDMVMGAGGMGKNKQTFSKIIFQFYSSRKSCLHSSLIITCKIVDCHRLCVLLGDRWSRPEAVLCARYHFALPFERLNFFCGSFSIALHIDLIILVGLWILFDSMNWKSQQRKKKNRNRSYAKMNEPRIKRRSFMQSASTMNNARSCQ